MLPQFTPITPVMCTYIKDLLDLEISHILRSSQIRKIADIVSHIINSHGARELMTN